MRATGVGPRVVFVGNPNSGKSTLFNALTGADAKVGNYAGITVATSEAPLRSSASKATAVDLPGTFSLAARSPDERVALDVLMGVVGPPPDLVVVVLDAPRLLRSLYLALQVLELDLPCVMALNLMDEARTEGCAPDPDALAELLGVPVIPTVARTGDGAARLAAVIETALADPDAVRPGSPQPWPEAVERALDRVGEALADRMPQAAEGSQGRRRGLAVWAVLSIDDDDALAGAEDVPRGAIAEVVAEAEAAGRDLPAELVHLRYAWIDAREASLMPGGGPRRSGHSLSDRIDRVLLNPFAGTVVFLATMALLFQALFSWADPFIGWIEAFFGLSGDGLGMLRAAAQSAVPALAVPIDIVGSLLVDGVVSGVGAVVVFVPQIAFLSLFVALLEDSGYLARAAYLMDRILRLAGLPGRAFVPLLSGYACAVPAIVATRTMPRFRDRLLTMMVIPLTSCSARLPVYTLLIGALFPATVFGWWPLRPTALFGMYVFSTIIALLAAVVLGRTLLRDRATPEILELPPYRVPSLGRVLRQTWMRTRSFLTEAGGIILLATIVLWALLSFPRYGPDDLFSRAEIDALEARGANVEALVAAGRVEHSFGGQIGHAIEPVIEPLGFDWRIGVGLIGAFAAREVFVSTMGVVYGVGAEADEESVALRDKVRGQVRDDGTAVFTPLVGVSLMVFFALAMQCMSTLSVMWRESGSWRWPAFTFVYMTALAWVASFAVYQVGALLGLG